MLIPNLVELVLNNIKFICPLNSPRIGAEYASQEEIIQKLMSSLATDG